MNELQTELQEANGGADEANIHNELSSSGNKAH